MRLNFSKMLYNQSFLLVLDTINEIIPTFVYKKNTRNESSNKNYTAIFISARRVETT